MKFSSRYAVPKHAAMARRAAMISDDDVERRVLRAIRTLKCVRDRDRSFLAAGAKSSMPDTLVEFADLVARAENPDPVVGQASPFFPTRADFGDYLLALSWVAALARLPNKRKPRSVRQRASRQRASEIPSEFDQRILWWVAFEFSFAAIGREINRDEYQAQRRYREIIADCWRIANGCVTLQDFSEGSSRPRQIEEVAG